MFRYNYQTVLGRGWTEDFGQTVRIKMNYSINKFGKCKVFNEIEDKNVSRGQSTGPQAQINAFTIDRKSALDLETSEMSVITA